eukprot:c5128_g1_i1.p1 GENE.c5128_g1_i1~~c5128_g1_i1.p1  ORF type:complete len:185 (+),score=30.09 c5128_g1_i1:30-557(+)
MSYWGMVLNEFKRLGVRGLTRKMMLMNELRFGSLKGRDQFGNTYFENVYYPFGRDRWVEPSESATSFDASIVPPEWHRWLHHMADDTPLENPPVMPKFRVEHEQNKTGTQEAYMGPLYLLTKHRNVTDVKPHHTESGGLEYKPTQQGWDPNRETAAEEEPEKDFREFLKRRGVKF